MKLQAADHTEEKHPLAKGAICQSNLAKTNHRRRRTIPLKLAVTNRVYDLYRRLSQTKSATIKEVPCTTVPGADCLTNR